MTVKVGPATVIQKVIDLCTNADPDAPKLECPLQPGEQTIQLAVDIPSNTPK